MCLFGAPGDTPNFGVSALMYATISGIAQRRPEASVTVFDNGWGVRPASTSVGERPFSYQLCGARLSRRYHRPESLWNMRVSGWLRGLGNAGVRLVRDADAVLDVSGGDSFSDLYGQKRFRSMVLPKLIALEQRTPLILLPQTYGPFSDATARRAAASVVRRASMAWARDADSFQALRELLGEAFDATRHFLGVDMAFGLEPVEPPTPISDWVRAWFSEDADAPIAGLNVSGLLYNDATAAHRYGLRADYRTAVSGLLRQLLQESDARVLLIPHVAGGASKESDVNACAHLLGSLSPGDRERVTIGPEPHGPREAKWLIAQLDWFCGTRMHATIAALSSGVPAAAIAYSVKTRGVFATCGQQEQVADARHLEPDGVVAVLWKGWCDREAIRADLAAQLPRTVERAQRQMDAIVGACVRPSEPANGSLETKGT
ncbi:MAG: polysaccharide pyruvyl transferase family protein [Actinobacteria bacterium]|nr:polysaccharide pyruvyl transferase family protein [Actinomycetota bacterium]